jgi:hypothetical protein
VEYTFGVGHIKSNQHLLKKYMKWNQHLFIYVVGNM